MKIEIRPLFIVLSFIFINQLYSQTGEVNRTIINFDAGWSFKNNITPWTWRYKYESANWEKVNLPHDWSIKGPFNKDEPSAGYGGYLPTGTGVYRKSFTLDKSMKEKIISIEFDGVYMNSEVYCNGVWLGKRPNGYVSFSYDITPYVKFGDFENKIIVLIDNSTQINTRWYSGSGITRHVRMLATDKIHIPQWGTFITTPVINKSDAVANIKTTIKNRYTTFKDVTLKTSLFDLNNKLIAEKLTPLKVKGNGEILADVNLTLSKPFLWSVQTPNLYKAKSEIISGGKIIDDYSTTFGVRKIRFDADKGFFLNDISTKIKGVCLHHDAGGVGAAVPEQMWERRLKLLKEMGCNAIRTSHNPFSPEFYDLCDKMGILVMDEFFDEWSIHKLPDVTMGYNLHWDKWWKKDLEDVIKRDRNHPSVFMYSAGNEIIEQNRPWGKDMAIQLVELCHKLDPTRSVTSGNNMMPEANMTGFADVFDVVGYNYGPQFEVYEEDRINYSRRKFIGTENTRGQSTRGVYVFPVPQNGRQAFSKEGYSSSYDFLFRKFGPEHEWQVTKKHDYIAGLFLWTGIDYLGEEDWPMTTEDCGAMDRCAFPKDAYYFYQSQWTDKPVLHLLPHWNWKGKEDEIIPVWSYTNCDEAELFLNGKSLGKKDFSNTDKLHLEWNVKYQPGELKAIGYKNGKQIIETIKVTTGEGYSLKAEADKNNMSTNGTDVVHLKISVVDKNNIEVPTSNEKFKITIKGPAKLLSVDNGDPAFKGNFQSTEGSLFNGLALAVIQSQKEKGTISILIEGTNINKAETIIINSF